MRNLRRIDGSVLKSPPDLRLTAAAWDAATDSLLCAFGPTQDNVLLELKRWHPNGKTFEPIASWEAPYPLPDLESDEILDLHYFSDSLTACVILRGGDIIVVREKPQDGEEKVEIVGSVDAGIAAAAWSPDEELLAIGTRAETLVYMTKDFDPVADVTFTREDLKASNHVSVGWGKQETQFKGRGTKALRDPTVPEKIDEGILSGFDEKNFSISWRGDGAYLAVNSIHEESRRIIRVYSREGALDSVSEPLDGLVGALSWRPAGNLICGVQYRDDGAKVVFFERNGLRHGQFDLRISKEELKTWASGISLKWNVDSSVLAVLFKDRIQMWTMGNYHYYLKQEIIMSSRNTQDAPVSLIWHPEKPLHFTMCSQQEVRFLTFASVNSIGTLKPPHDYGIVAVIDGKHLKLTAMRFANIPPPMSQQEVMLDRNATDVRLSSSSIDESVVLIDIFFGDREHSQYQWSMQTKGRDAPVLVDDKVSTISVYPPDLDSAACGPPTLESAVWHGYSQLAANGTANGDVETSQTKIIFSLSENGSLFANDRRLVRNCTSFLVSHLYLIVTTSQHLVKFVHLGSQDIELELPPDTPESDERCRSIERGARLVTAMPSIFAVVLQMPRGNLETIYPRALVLAGVRDSINKRKYKRAFLACRNQRVDMNILHDHAPQQFISNVNMFIDQVQKVGHIDLFLSQLRSEDVSKTMYKETLRTAEETEGKNNSAEQGTKINRICDAFLKALKGRMSTHSQNAVTAHVCKSPPDLDAGLSQIAELRTANPELVDAAIEHICFLADVNRLYDNALGLYDLRLASLIAQQSQKDPKEYGPFLQNLQRMTPLRMQYEIDNYLGRFQKALHHLCDLKAFEEVKSYTIKHDLYTTVLNHYRYQEARLNDLMRLYADHLSNSNDHASAGLAYDFLSDYVLASDSYRQAHLWKESLAAASLIPFPGLQQRSLAISLADSLTETKNFTAAATIHTDYLSDIPTAARLYCKGYHFTDAIRLSGLHHRPDLLASVIDPGLVEGMTSMTELLADCKSQLSAQVPRIHELRTKKAEDPLAFFDSEGIGGADIPDNVSLAPTDASTTGGSLFTRYTNRTGGTAGTGATRRTSKNRRREERKRARGKKGSVYEEEYLVNSVARLVERVNLVNEEVERLVVGLMRQGMRERAAAVESAMVEVVGLCKQCIPEIFGDGMEDGKGVVAGEVSEGVRPKGGEGILWDTLESSKPIETPVVKEFGELSLLGR